jgi:hypothetical protein
VTLTARRRGRYELRAPTLRLTDPLRLATGLSVAASPQTLLVYPRFFRMDAFPVPLGRRYQPGGIPLSSNTGDAIEFVGTRDYREGDAIRNIHWRSWARRGQPVVKEYQEEYFSRVALILDTFMPARPGPADGAGRDDRGGQQAEDDHERPLNRELSVEPFVEPHHLQADEDQNQRQGVLEQMEAFNRAGEQEVHRPQAQDREDVRREHNQRLARDGIDRRDRIDGKDDVAHLEEQERDKQRCRMPAAVHPHEEMDLRLNSQKAIRELRWVCQLPLDEALAWTADWFRRHGSGQDARSLCEEQIDRYMQLSSS